MSIAKFERPNHRLGFIYQRWRIVMRCLKRSGFTALIFVITRTLGVWQQRRLVRKIERGETIWLDYKPPGAQDPHYPGGLRGDMTPNETLPKRKAKAMQLTSYPEPVYPFKYRQPPPSGMLISGWQEREKRRPATLFFKFDVPWRDLFRLFLSAYNSPAVLTQVLALVHEDWRRDGPVSPQAQRVTNKRAMSGQIKALAESYGAALVGITQPKDEWFFEGFTESYQYAIALAIPMDREEMRYATTERTHLEVFRIYRKVGQVAARLAAEIRKRGYPARAATNIAPDNVEVQHVPVAIAAGLGQLGKHNSIITKDYGANVRLATVLTDLPLETDQPQDIGVDDFCASCQICTTNCPPQAIFETKQVVRGEERWFINFDKCVPYFVAHQGCAICIEVCPWSEPGQGEVIMEKMLAARG